MEKGQTTGYKFKLSYIITLTVFCIVSFFLSYDKYGIDRYGNGKLSVGVDEVLLQPVNQPKLELLNNKYKDTLFINANYYSRIFLSKNSKNNYQAWYDLFLFLWFVPAIVIIVKLFIQFYKFINAIAIKEVFNIANVKRLKAIGIYCILLDLINLIYEITTFKLQQFLFEGLPYNVIPKFSFDAMMVIIGIVFLTIAYAFKKGIQLQQENDLTV